MKTHAQALDSLVTQLHNIGEKSQDINWIMREGIWYRQDGTNTPFCDLIVVYSNYAVPIELKHSSARHSHAIEQLKFGKNFIQQELRKECDYGKVVYYDMPVFYFEKVKL